MADKHGPAYEVTHTLDGVNVVEFDEWLGQHIQ